MAWDAKQPIQGSGQQSAPIRDNFQALDTAVMAILPLVPAGSVLTVTDGHLAVLPATPVAVESPDVPVNTTGAKTVVIPHGLGAAPTPSRVQLSMRRTSPTLTAVVGAGYLDAVDATNLTVKVSVAQAGGAADTVRIMAWILR